MMNGRPKNRRNLRTRRTGIGTVAIAIIAVVVMIVGAMGVIALTSQSKSSTSSSASSSATQSQTTATLSSSTGIATASVSNSSDGLNLNLQVNAGGNGTFTVTVAESNLLSSVNNVTEANQWKYPADLLNPANNCAPTNDPVGFAIFQGYYGMSNYTSGKALPLYNTNVEFHCTENIYANEYLFQPLSDSISVYNHGQFETNGTASLSLLTGGYWTGGAGTPTAASFNEFRGVYTVLAADEWGNVLLLHFTVD
jgi:flagellar basal body-associated protein FliL